MVLKFIIYSRSKPNKMSSLSSCRFSFHSLIDHGPTKIYTVHCILSNLSTRRTLWITMEVLQSKNWEVLILWTRLNVMSRHFAQLYILHPYSYAKFDWQSGGTWHEVHVFHQVVQKLELVLNEGPSLLSSPIFLVSFHQVHILTWLSIAPRSWKM